MGQKIRPGYKQTEVGVIPEDWSVSPLRDLVDPARGIRYGIVQPGPFVHNGRLLIRGQDYSKGWVDATEMYRVGDAIEARYRNARVVAGDLIITIVGASTGHVEEVPDWLDAANLTQTTARIAINKRRAEPRFAKYILASSLGESHVSNYVKGGAQPGLNCGDVEKFLIPHPTTVEEQRAIAAALVDADALISALEGMIAKKRDLKQAAVQHLLTGKTRLPGFSGEWEVKRLGDVASLYQSETIAQTVFKPSGYPVYGANGIVGYYDRYNHAEPQITLSCRGNCGAINKTFGPAWITGNAMVINIEKNPKLIFEFFYQLLRSIDFSILVSGSGQPQIVRGPLRKFEIRLPSDPAEQSAIAEVLSDMDADRAALEAQAAKARAVKQGMMQELLTGRVRLV